MTDDQLQPAPEKRRREHPIVSGVIALVAVAAVVGGVIGGGALVATRALGLDDGDGLDSKVTSSQTLFLPDPTATDLDPNDDVTIPGVPSESSTPSDPVTTSDKPEKEPPPISLVAGQAAVAPMQQLDLSGIYPDGEGSILRVQQFEGGTWTDFPVTASVSGGQFRTYIQASAVGLNKFRMIDTDNGAISNVITVQIG